MQITINTKMIKRVLSKAYDQTIPGEYEKKIIKEAGIISKKEFVDKVIVDPKFQAELVKYFTKYIHDEEFLFDVLYELDIKLLDQMVDDCEEILYAEYQKQADEMGDQEIKHMIESLNAAGYRVEKTV